MARTKDIYILEWNGPYSSYEEMRMKEGIENCSIYLITGKNKYSSNNSRSEVKYIGITERDVSCRVKEPAHLKKQHNIKDIHFWAARFQNTSLRKDRQHAELVEWCLVRFLAIIDAPIINKKKTKTDPKHNVTVISKWGMKLSDDYRVYKSSKLWWLSDVIVYDTHQFWYSDKLIYAGNTI